ncbi:MAG: hypothetical protein AAFY65_05075 [Pseudomonadota bacterium]
MTAQGSVVWRVVDPASLLDRVDFTIGLAPVSLRIAALAPSPEVSRALEGPTFGRLQQKADEAMFARRALAVEKARAIAENELANQVELAARQGENARAEARRIREVEQAAAKMERQRMEALGRAGTPVLCALAALDLGGTEAEG